MSLSAKMATPLAASLAGRLAGNAGEDRIAAILGDRLRWSSDAEVGSYLLGTSPDVQTLYNNAVAGLADGTQGSAAARPHLSTFAGHNVLEHTSKWFSGGGGDNILDAGDYPTLISVLRFISHGSVRGILDVSTDGASLNTGAVLHHYSVVNGARGGFETLAGAINPFRTLTDTTALHVVRTTLTPAGAVVAVDGAEGTFVSTANTGLRSNLPYLNVGSYAGGSLVLQGVIKKSLVARSVTPAEITEIEAILMAEIA